MDVGSRPPAHEPGPVERPGGRSVDGVDGREEVTLLHLGHHAAAVGRAGTAAFEDDGDARVVVTPQGLARVVAPVAHDVEDGLHGSPS